MAKELVLETTINVISMRIVIKQGMYLNDVIGQTFKVSTYMTIYSL